MIIVLILLRKEEVILISIFILLVVMSVCLLLIITLDISQGISTFMTLNILKDQMKLFKGEDIVLLVIFFSIYTCVFFSYIKSEK